MNNIGYIICETDTTVSVNSKVIKEETLPSGKKRVVAEGILQTADEKNRNGRIYPKEELFPQLTSPRTMELFNAGYMRGECGHPLSPELARQQTIDGKLCCVKYLKFWTQGNDVWGRFCGTNNALGDEFDADLREGCKPAFSLRALGSINETSGGAKVTNLKLITYDNVIYPSHPGAYTHNLVTESAIVKTYSRTGDCEKRPSGLLVPITNESVISYIKSESANFKTIRESFDLLYDDIRLIENGSSVQLTTKTGSVIIVTLENYIHNEIMNYCVKL